MYHCHMRLYFIGSDPIVFKQLKEMSPFEHFSFEFKESKCLDSEVASESDVIFADLRDSDIKKTVFEITSAKGKNTEIIVLLNKEQTVYLSDNFSDISDIWILPMTDDEMSFLVDKWHKNIKLKEDYRENTHYLETTINSIPNLIWYKDKNGIHEKVNDSFCNAVGKTKKQIQGRGHAYIWDVENDDPACIESERIVMEKEETFVSEEKIMTGDGEKLLTVYKSPLYDSDGGVMGTVGVAIDITKEREYAEEIINKNRTLETLFTTIECGIMCHSVDGSEIISINRAALNILGYSSIEEMMSEGFDMVAATVHDDDKEMLREHIRSLKNPGDNVSLEYRVRHHDNKILYVMGNVKLVEENGKLFYQRYLLDCTAQKLRDEHMLREKERRQMALVYALSIEYTFVCLFDLDTGIGQILRNWETENEVVGRIFSEPLMLEDCMGKYIEECVYSEDKKAMLTASSREQIINGLSEKDICSVVYRADYSGELRYFQMKAVRAGDWKDKREIVLGFCSVDREIKEEMQKKTLLEGALAQANKANMAKSTFLSNMSHDIRTPMNAIIGFTNLAITHIDKKDRVSDYLNKIESSGNHLLKLINDILDMSYIESGKIHIEERPCNLSEIAKQMYNMIQPDANDKRLVFSVDTSEIVNEEIVCDSLRLDQVLLNLLSNAVKYTEDGGSILFKIAEISSEKDGFSNYEFTVSDTGIGMSDEFLKRIFEPFERERNSTVSGINGTGLGMAITKNIVDMMNGTISVSSRIGVGTECKVRLMFRLNSDGSFVKDEKGAEDFTDILTGHVLLVEDNDLNREIAVEILEEVGFTVDTAENGKIAVDMLKNSEPGYFQVVLMDIQMPVMNGYEATTEIRAFANKELASIPILAMTANAFEEDRQNALKCGMDGHLAKPIDIDKLISTLDRVLRQNSI